MRFIQTLLDKLVCLALLLTGAWLLAWHLTELPAAVARFATPEAAAPEAARQGAERVTAVMAMLDPAYRNVYLAVGGVLLVVGLLTFIPRFPKRVAKALRLGTDKGTTTVDLKPIERRLTQIAKALPEVVDVDLAVKLTKDKKRISIAMDVVLLKDGPSSAKSMSEKLKRAMMASAANVLGSDLVTDVEVHVRDVRLSKSSNIIDIATLPAPAAAEASGYLSHHGEERWSQKETAPPTYLDGSDIQSAAASAPVDSGYQPPSSMTSTTAAPAPYSETPAPEAAPEPAPEKESPFGVPTLDRDPVDTIDNIIMVDEEDAGRFSERPIFDDDDEDREKKESDSRGY